MTRMPPELVDDLDAIDLDAEDWPEADGDRLASAFRLALHDTYADASDEDVRDALSDVLDQMTPAEAFNFTSALNQIGRSAGQIVADPTFGAIARTALPIAGGALGTVIGGPIGTALGTQLGTVAAGALPTRGPSPTARPAVAAAVPGLGVAPPVAPGPTGSPLAGGSPAAAQALVLTQQPQVLQGLLAGALGQHGQQSVGGIPVAQLLGMLSQVFGQAASDADALMYSGGEGDSESVLDDVDSPDALYETLVDADNLELSDLLGARG
jgi:hypothetical protein